jgi:hypothetical protein
LGYRVVSRAELRGEKKPFKGYVGFGAIPRYNQPAELTCKTKTYSTHPEPTLFCFASRMDATPVREFATVEAYPPVFNINFRFKG